MFFILSITNIAFAAFAAWTNVLKPVVTGLAISVIGQVSCSNRLVDTFMSIVLNTDRHFCSLFQKFNGFKKDAEPFEILDILALGQNKQIERLSDMQLYEDLDTAIRSIRIGSKNCQSREEMENFLIETRRIMVFYRLDRSNYICMLSPEIELLTCLPRIISDHLNVKADCDFHHLLSCSICDPEDLLIPEEQKYDRSQRDCTDIVLKYLGPGGDFHKDVPFAAFDAALMMDHRGNIIFDETSLAEDSSLVHVVMLDSDCKLIEKDINLSQLMTISTTR